MHQFIRQAGLRLASRAVDDVRSLVDLSSPTGDRDGAEAALAALICLLPAGVELERSRASTVDCAPDFVARLRGTGQTRILLLGHMDTVISHADHRPVRVDGDRVMGSGTYDMKGGLVVAAAVMRELASKPETFAELALLIVNDEEQRTGPLFAVDQFGGFDACLCFEGGEPAAGGRGVVVRRKGAASLAVEAFGLASHAGAAPDEARSALAALAELVTPLTQRRASGLTVTPTVFDSGQQVNQVPQRGRLICDVRGFDNAEVRALPSEVPTHVNGVRLETTLLERFPGMDTAAAVEGWLARAGELAELPVVAVSRGGSSDACHFARVIRQTVDGLGPTGGADHGPNEHVWASSFAQSLELALAAALTVETILVSTP